VIHPFASGHNVPSIARPSHRARCAGLAKLVVACVDVIRVVLRAGAQRPGGLAPVAASVPIGEALGSFLRHFMLETALHGRLRNLDFVDERHSVASVD
jgi:hypothetical protein